MVKKLSIAVAYALCRCLLFKELHDNFVAMEKRITIIAIFLILGAVAICYSNTLSAGFIWDDQFLIERNPIVRAPLWSYYAFKQDIANSSGSYTIYYRPLQMISYAIDYRLWGMTPSGFHLTNILIHLLNAVCIFVLTKKLSSHISLSLLTALLFAVHPAHAGAVSYVSGRADLLFALFTLLSLIAFTIFRERKDPAYLIISSFAFACALLSKEIAIIIPVLIILTDYAILSDNKRSRLWAYFPSLLIAIAYIVIHGHFFGNRYSSLSFDNNILSDLSGYLKMLTEFFSIAVFPAGSYMRRSITSTGSAPLSFALITGSACAAYIALKEYRKLIPFALLFFAAALLPLLFIIGYFQVFAEHWMYLASYGVFLFEALILTGLFRHSGKTGKTLSILLILAALCISSFTTIYQNRYWRENSSLSDRILAYSEKDRASLHYKAVDSFRSGHSKESLDIAQRYAETNSHDPMPWYTKGRLELAAGNTETAETDFRTAIKIDPAYANGYLGMAFVSFARNNTEEGILYLEDAIKLNPSHREALTLLSATYLSMDMNERALEVAKRAKKTNPYDYNTLLNLGTAYIKLGNIQEGARQYLEAARLYPEKAKAFYNLAYLFHKSGEDKKALEYLDKALKNDPGLEPALELQKEILQQ